MIKKQLELVRDLVEFIDSGDYDECDLSYFDVCKSISLVFPKNLCEQLQQLVSGPIYDGDIISKNSRDFLLRMGLAIRVCCKGEQGYTGATYTAHTVLEFLKQ